MTREERTLLKEKEEEQERKKERRKRYFLFFIKLTTIFMILIFSILLYSRFVATSGLIIREYNVSSSRLPKEFHGFKIIHFTDLHYGSTITKNEFQSVVDTINRLKPDIIVFTGDLIDKDHTPSEEETLEITSLMKRLDAKIGKYAVSGNHDFSHEYYHTILTDSNFTFLDNTYDFIYYEGLTPILLTGIGSSIKGNMDIEQALSYYKQENSQDLYTIALMHEPDNVDLLRESHTIDLALAGHSHNGQIRLPFVGALIKVKGAKKYDDAFYQVGNTPLYISGGLGTSTYKYRLFNRPSINLYRLTHDEEQK